MAPVVAKARVMLGEWPKVDKLGREIGSYSLADNAPNLAKQVNNWSNFIAGKNVTLHPEMAKVLGVISRNSGAAVIAFNFRSAALQWTSLLNTAVEVGYKNLVRGIMDSIPKENRQRAKRESQHLTGRSMDVHIEDMWSLNMAKAINKGRSAAAHIGTFPLRMLDRWMADISWLAAERKGKADGLTGYGLRRFNDDVVIKTQASAAAGDLAQIQTTAHGKLMTLFQTYVINNWNYWGRDVFGWKNPEMATADRVRKVSRLLFGAFVINTIFEDVLDMNSPLPAPEREIVKGIREGKGIGEIGLNVGKEIAESIPIIGGAIKYTDDRRQSYPPLVSQVVDTVGILSGVNRIIKNNWDLSKMSQYQWAALAKLFGVPGTAEAQKIMARLKAGVPLAKAIAGTKMPDKNKAGKTNLEDNLR